MTRFSQAGKGAASKSGGKSKDGGKKGGKSKDGGKKGGKGKSCGKTDPKHGPEVKAVETVSLTRSQKKWRKFREKAKAKKIAETVTGEDADQVGDGGAGDRKGSSSSPAFTPVNALPTPPVPAAMAVKDDSGPWVDKSFPPKPWSVGKNRDDIGDKKGKGKSKSKSKFGKGKWKTKNN